MNAPVVVSSPWSWWKAALADPSKIGSPALPVHDGEAHQGFYRMRDGKGGPWVAVAITPVDYALVAVVGAWGGGDHRDAGEVWSWCCRYPVARDLYMSVAVDGKDWPDAISASEPAAEEAASIGHNSGAKPADVFVELRDKLDEIAGKALAESDKIGKVTKDTWTKALEVKKDRIANWSESVAKIGKEIEAAFEVEKKPWRDGGTAVDVKWRDLKAKAPATVKKLKAKVAELINAQEAYLKEEAEKAAEAARVMSPELDAPAPVVEPVRVSAGTAGRKIHTVDVPVATINDPLKFVEWMLSPDREYVSELLTETLNRLAQGYAKLIVEGAVSVPGISAEIKRMAR